MHSPSYGESYRFIFWTRKVRSGVLLHATHTKLLFFSEAFATDREKCASCPSKAGNGGGGGRDRGHTLIYQGAIFIHRAYM